MTQPLRTGRTTGSCASAAVMAGIAFLLDGVALDRASVPLPPGGYLTVPIERIQTEGNGVRVTVIKDGGDDPDATHGCEIQAVVTLHRHIPGPLSVRIDGGDGVGRVTLPGLPVKVGYAAINPEPLKQIETAARQAAAAMQTGRIDVIIEVPDGETIALKTMNSRLGILGGISILGTQGIIKPYSHDSWKATIEEGLDVIRAQGLDRVVFTTGRRSERFYLEKYPDTPELVMIQAADFFEFAMQAAAQRGFAEIKWTLFFGKLVKQAQGLAYTHAKSSPVDFDLLAERCMEVGIGPVHFPEVRGANTAIQVFETLKEDPARNDLIRLLIKNASQHAYTFAGTMCAVSYTVFDFDGHTLGH